MRRHGIPKRSSFSATRVLALALCFALAADGALAGQNGEKGWIARAINSQKAPAQAPAVKASPKASQGGDSGSGGGKENEASSGGGGGYEISSATGGGGMDATALLGTQPKVPPAAFVR